MKKYLGSIYFDKKTFVETIAQIKEQIKHDSKCSKAFMVVMPNDFISGYDNHRLQNQLLKILQIAFDDLHKESWIEYFIWELDFGKKYKHGCASNADGSNINLSSAGKLWEFLIKE